MKTYLLKKEKWYNESYSIYQSGELIGEYLSARFKRPHRLSLRDREYTFRKKSVWRQEMELYLGNIKVAEILPHNFREKVSISKAGLGNFEYKKTKFWKNTSTLFEREKPIGECTAKAFKTQLIIGDELNIHLLAAMIFISQQRKQAYLVFVALIPVYISVFS